MTVPGIGWQEALRAATLLFGAGSAARLREPGWRSELKSAYRERVLQTHPDRAAALGRATAELEAEFRAVSEAFELLQRFDGTPACSPPLAPPAATAPSRGGDPQRAGSAALRAKRPGEAVLPQRRLRLAELLHHLGLIRREDVGAAVAWQRAQRPSVGRLAERFGYLDRAAVAALLAARLRDGASRQRFASFAVARGQLTPFQRLVLLGQQGLQQRPIGAFFVERGLCTEPQLAEARVRLLRHNLRQAA